MYRLIYLSRAASWLNDEAVDSIVQQAQEKNARCGITGFLCLRDGYFLQYLEGEETALRELYAKICLDDRHEVLKTVELGHHEERNFSNWTMRYLDIYYMGQLALEDMLEGVVVTFGRGSIEDSRVRAMAERLVGLVAELAH